jgi:hypothetical protein
MAAEFHLAEYALALHLLLQHLEGLVDIVVTDENLHAAFLSDRAIDGSDGQGARSHWRTEDVYNSGAGATMVRTDVDIPNYAGRWALWLPIGGNENFGTSPFFGQLIRQVIACLHRTTMGMPETKNNRGHRFCAEWPAPGSEDTKLGVFMGPEVSHGATKIYAGV